MRIRTLAPDTEPKKRRPVAKPGVFIEDYEYLFFANFSQNPVNTSPAGSARASRAVSGATPDTSRAPSPEGARTFLSTAAKVAISPAQGLPRRDAVEMGSISIYDPAFQ